MQTGARRGPKPQPHTRDKLIQVGVQLLHGGGYTATGVKDIVDAAEVPKGSFYNHFASKEAFGQEAVDHYFNSALAELRALLTDPDVPPLERLRTYFETRTQGFAAAGYVRGCLLGNLSLEVGDQSAAIRERLAAHLRTWSDLFAGCIAEAQASGTIAGRLPASMLADFLLNGWEGALLRMRTEKSDLPLKTFRAVVFDALLV